ncbi:MAG TPA: DUF1569 domain-containing protein [Vicinamibacteria bacterium]
MKTLARPEHKAEILRRLSGLGPESTRRWGRMTVHQMVCHLCDSYRMAMGQKAVSEAAGPLQRTVVKWIALYLPLRWPAGIRTRPEIDQCLGSGTSPAAFAEDLAQLRGLTEDFTTRAPSLAGSRHPIFGPMSEAAWLRWSYLHMDHHLRQFGA